MIIRCLRLPDPDQWFRMAKVNLAWTKNLKSQKEKEDFEKLLLNNTILIRRFKEILTEMKQGLAKDELSKDAYTNNSWPYYQADIIGSKRQIRIIEDLFDFEGTQ